MGSFVNAASGWARAGSSSVATGTAVAVAVHNLLVATLRWEGGARTINLVDTAGNTWLPLTQRIHTNGDLGAQMFYVKDAIAHAANIVTANYSSDAIWKGLLVQQFSGCDNTAPLVDDDFGIAAAANPATCTALGITGGGVVVAGHALYSTWSAWTNSAAGYTLTKNGDADLDAGRCNGASYKLVTAAGSEAPTTDTTGGSDDMFVLGAFFKDAGGGAPAAASLVPFKSQAERYARLLRF